MSADWHIETPPDSPRFAVLAEGPDFRNEAREEVSTAGHIGLVGSLRPSVSAMRVSYVPCVDDPDW